MVNSQLSHRKKNLFATRGAYDHMERQPHAGNALGHQIHVADLRIICAIRRSYITEMGLSSGELHSAA
jgi:hypothetical protein